MILNDFAFCHENRFNYLIDLVETDETTYNLKRMLEDDFDITNVKYQKSGVDSNGADADVAYFRSSHVTLEGSPVWVVFETNDRPNSQKWFLLEFVSEQELQYRILRKNNIECYNIIFDSFGDMRTFLDDLRNAAQEEEWKFKSDTSSTHDWPVLRSYFEYTFKRLMSENKILYSDDRKKAIFNTGLLDREFLMDIYVMLDVKKIQILGQEVMIFSKPEIIIEDNRRIAEYFGKVTPELAKYFTKISDIVYNPDLDLDLNWKHIFKERVIRIPEEVIQSCGSIKEIVQKFRGNEEILKKLAKRNYKMVVPQFHHGKIQFLLPVYLGTEYSCRPDFALVLDYDEKNNYYFGSTILTVGMAYNNARLIAKPDNPWLTNEVDAD